MIITRSPLRISLGGGGTDLRSYYRDFGGFVIAAAIDKYVYITIHETFAEDLIFKYSQMERVKRLEDIQHPLIREALALTGPSLDGFGDRQHVRYSSRHRAWIERKLSYRAARRDCTYTRRRSCPSRNWRNKLVTSR